MAELKSNSAPPAERKQYWGDEVEEEAASRSAPPKLSWGDVAASSIDDLSIRETEFNGLLDEPEELNIKAVMQFISKDFCPN